MMSDALMPLGEVKFNPHVPRHSKAFLLLSSELNHAAHARSNTIDWKALDKLCQRIFKRYGYDLHSGAWYCLIQLRLQGWEGAAKSVELLASALSYHERTLGQHDDSRHYRSSLEWFCSNAITPMYTQPQRADDAEALSRTSAALEIIGSQAKRAEINGAEIMANLCYFLKVRARSSAQVVLDLQASAPAQLVCRESALQPILFADTELPDEIHAPERVNQEPVSRWGWGITALLLLMLGGLGLYNYFMAVAPALRPYDTMTQVKQQFIDANIVEKPLSKAEFAALDRHLQAVATQPVGWLMQQSNQLARKLGEKYPGNQASVHWQQWLEQEKQLHPLTQGEGWIIALKRLDALEQRLLESEKKQRNHLTISELKTEVYVIKRALQQMETPVSVLLWQLSQDQGNTQHLYTMAEKQMNGLMFSYLSLLNSRYSDPH